MRAGISIMPYRYLEEVAIADAAFEAWGETLEEMLTSASDATVNIMIGDLDSIRCQHLKHLRIADDQVDMLLFQLLQELIYYKDAERLLLRVRTVRLEHTADEWIAWAELAGETIDPKRHDLAVDIKAVTLHQFSVQQNSNGWTASVIIDV
jgi:SHS2 domain-containing protein